MRKNKIMAKSALCLSMLAMLTTLFVFGVSAESMGDQNGTPEDGILGDISEGLDDMLPGTDGADTDGITDPANDATDDLTDDRTPDDSKTDNMGDSTIMGSDTDSTMQNSTAGETSRAVWIIITVIAVVVIVVIVIALVTKK